MHDDFPLDKYPLDTSLEAPVNPLFSPHTESWEKCTMEEFLQTLPNRYFAYETFRRVYGTATVIGMFTTKRRTKYNEAILEATKHREHFIQSGIGGERGTDKQPFALRPSPNPTCKFSLHRAFQKQQAIDAGIERGLTHYAARQPPSVPACSSCLPLPCMPLSGTPWWGATPTTHMEAPSPSSSRKAGDPVVRLCSTSEHPVGSRLIP